MARLIRWIVMGFGAFVLIVALAALLDDGVATEADAISQARSEARRFLVSPASADFHSEAAQLQPDRDHRWAVIGRVDSQNAFGALLTSDYIAVVQNLCGGQTGDGCWQVQELVLNGERVLETVD